MAEEDEITYVDLGDRWMEIDNRGDVQRRTILPKSARDIGVATALRQELEARIEQEVIAPAKAAEEADPLDSLPPAESDEDREKREKKAQEQIAKADEQLLGEQEEAQERVRQTAPTQTSGSSSKKS